MNRLIFFCLVSMAISLTHGLAENIHRTDRNETCRTKSFPSSKDQEDELNLLTKREKDRRRYIVEQKTILDFSREKGTDYSSYFAPYCFCVEVDRLKNKFFIISKSGSLQFEQSEIEEIERRTLFIDEFEDLMDSNYFNHSDIQGSFNPHRFGWPEYNVPYFPFTSVNNTDTHIYGFLNIPKHVITISGTNFLEKGPFGKQTNPQAIFIDYEFGPMRNGTLEERTSIRHKSLNEEFKKTLPEITNPEYVNRFHLIDRARSITGKSKNEVAVLDIGCGLGKVLNMLRLEGYKKLYGIDMDSSKIHVLQNVCEENGVKEINAAVVNMNSENVIEILRNKLKQNVFDIVLLHDTIEHIPDPRRTLHTIHSLLAKNGIVLFTGIPDEDSLAARFDRNTYGDYDKFTHVNFFTKESILAFAKQNCFDVTFLSDSDGSPKSNWSFIFDECLPYVNNGKWHVLGRELPYELTIRDVFPDSALTYNIFSCRPIDGPQVKANFERYKLYEKHKEHVNLLFKKFFIDSTRKIVSSDELLAKLEDLKQNLYNTLVLDNPTGITPRDRELLAFFDDSKSVNIKAMFEEMYQISLRTRACFFVKQSEVPT